MINTISFNATQMLALDSSVEISSQATFNAQEAYENTFEDVLQETVSQVELNKINNVQNLGKPCNFNIECAEHPNYNQNNKINSFVNLSGFEAINFKNGINNYILQSLK